MEKVLARLLCRFQHNPGTNHICVKLGNIVKKGHFEPFVLNHSNCIFKYLCHPIIITDNTAKIHENNLGGNP